MIRWSPGIGDPSIAGWLTVAGYLATSLFCARASARAGKHSLRPRRISQVEMWFWRGAFVAYLCLAVNKQLDMQSLFTEIARAAAKSGGWYAERATLQMAFILFLVIAAGAVATILLRILRGTCAAVRTAAVGMILTGGYIVLRASSFHHADTMLFGEVLGVRWNWILELGAIALVAVSACFYGRRDIGSA